MYFGGRQRDILSLIILAILLFIAGRFYKEIDTFFNTAASVIGLLFATIAGMVYIILFQKIKYERHRANTANHYSECEDYRKEIRSQNEIIDNLKTEKQALKAAEFPDKMNLSYLTNVNNGLISENAKLISELGEVHIQNSEKSILIKKQFKDYMGAMDEIANLKTEIDQLKSSTEKK